jgi:hypothetical protein
LARLFLITTIATTAPTTATSPITPPTTPPINAVFEEEEELACATVLSTDKAGVTSKNQKIG